MTVFEYKLCLLLLTLAPEMIWSRGRFECGENGRFEYCIDEIPGCVVGCYCYPGYYFDTNSKICEPNSNLARSRSSNPDNKRNKSFRSKQSANLTSAEERVSQQFAAMAKDGSDLTDWLYKTFFAKVERQAEKQSTKKRKNKPKFAAFKKKYRYISITQPPEVATYLGDEIDGDVEDEGSSSSAETESGEEIQKSKEDSSSDSGDHEHEHVLVMKRSQRTSTTASPPLPSFIFLPSMDTPYYPPLGLPVPPVVPMYPAVPVPPVVPNFPIPEIPPNAIYAKDACSQCHEIIKDRIFQTIVKSKTIPNMVKKKKRRFKIRPAPILKPESTSKKSIKTIIDTSTTFTPIESTSQTSLSTIVDPKKSTAEFISKTTTVITKLTTETKLPITTEIAFNSTTDKTLQSTAATSLNTTIETIFTKHNMSTMTTETSVSASSRMNNSNVHDAFRRAQNIKAYYEFLDDLNASKMFDKRQKIRNQELKSIRMNDRIMKNGDSTDNTLRWTDSNSKEQSLMQNDFSDLLHADKFLNNKMYHKLPVTKNVDFEYLSDIVHSPEFNANKNILDSHAEHNIMEYKTNLAQSHDTGYASPIKDLENGNLESPTALLVRNPKTEQGKVESEDRDINLKDIPRMPLPQYFSEKKLYNLENKLMEKTPRLLGLPKKENSVSVMVQENSITPNVGNTIINNDNVYWPQENKKVMLNIKPLKHIVDENKIVDRGNSKTKFWSGSNEQTKNVGHFVAQYKPYISEQVTITHDFKELPKQSLRHQQMNTKDTKNAIIFNHNPLSKDIFMGITRRPERSYIGRTFFSGDIM